MNEKDLLDLWRWAVSRHGDWKRRSQISDLLVQQKWSVIWADLAIGEYDPLVENLYLEALEDKAAQAASIVPFIEVAPTRGTRDDEAERNAQLRRRIFISFMRDSFFEDKQQAWYFDWFQHGLCAAVPWVDWNREPRHPFLVRMDPRTVYPVASDSNEQTSACLIVKYRRLVDLANDPVAQHALPALRTDIEGRGKKMPEAVQEVWWMDADTWGLAYAYSPDMDSNLFRYVSPINIQGAGAMVRWAIEPHPHLLNGCPAVVKIRRTPDGEIRGALDNMIPNLRVAQNVMARILQDLERNVAAPDMIEGVENPTDFGPGALLIGTGEGKMRYESARRPMNLEALQQVALQREFARGAGAFPQQRSGEPGASINSAKGITASMGSYSTQQGWSQRDIALFYRLCLSRLANFDEQWCPGRKEITGWDEGEIYTDKYNPATLWKGDHRLEVGFHNMGLDEHNYLVRLGVAKNMGGLARRSFMRKSGLVANPLSEERDIALEGVTDAFQALMFQQASAGNPQPLMEFAQAIDGDQTTSRQAAMSVIKKLYTVPEGGTQGQPGSSPDVLSQIRSLEQGGIPGQAANLPEVSGGLASILPAQNVPALAEAAPTGA
jgi:hypothetical protein